jgi:hypothetical protein
MDYKFLASRAIQKALEETELSVGQLMRVITQEKFTGVKIENRSRFEEITDKEWYELIESAQNNEIETEFFHEQK